MCKVEDRGVGGQIKSKNFKAAFEQSLTWDRIRARKSWGLLPCEAKQQGFWSWIQNYPVKFFNIVQWSGFRVINVGCDTFGNPIY